MTRTTEQLRQEQRDYYRLCDEAQRLGIPTSLDDPRAIRTIPEFTQAIVAAAHAEALRPSAYWSALPTA